MLKVEETLLYQGNLLEMLFRQPQQFQLLVIKLFYLWQSAQQKFGLLNGQKLATRNEVDIAEPLVTNSPKYADQRWTTDLPEMHCAILSFLDAKNTALSREIAQKLYVDKIMLQANLSHEAIANCKQTKEMFLEIGLNLREFESNTAELNKSIPDEDKPHGDKIKLLGNDCNVEKDELSVKTKFLCPENLCKRNIVVKWVLCMIKWEYALHYSLN